MQHRAKLDKNEELALFSETLEQSVIKAVEQEHFTKDLAALSMGVSLFDVREGKDYITTEQFLEAIDKNFKKEWSKIMT